MMNDRIALEIGRAIVRAMIAENELKNEKDKNTLLEKRLSDEDSSKRKEPRRRK